MEKLDVGTLGKLSEAVMREIKADAEKRLEAAQATELIITNKAQSLIQVIFPIFILLCGLVIEKAVKHDFGILFYASCCQSVVLFHSCFHFFQVAALDNFTYLGVKPSLIVGKDLIEEENFVPINHYLGTRIYNLQLAIDKSIEPHNRKVVNYRKGFNVMLIGTAVISFVFALILMVAGI